MRTSFELPNWKDIKKMLDGTSINDVLKNISEDNDNYQKKVSLLKMYDAPDEWVSKDLNILELSNCFLSKEKE